MKESELKLKFKSLFSVRFWTNFKNRRIRQLCVSFIFMKSDDLVQFWVILKNWLNRQITVSFCFSKLTTAFIGSNIKKLLDSWKWFILFTKLIKAVLVPSSWFLSKAGPDLVCLFLTIFFLTALSFFNRFFNQLSFFL